MPAERSCEECGTSFVAKSNRNRFCKTACRVKAHRRPDKVGAAKAAADAASSEGPPAPTYDSLAEQIRDSLTELEALNTISGMAALRVAQQIDRGGDSGSAVATLTKELSRLVAEAKVESAPKRRDAADDIASKVIAKLQGLATA